MRAGARRIRQAPTDQRSTKAEDGSAVPVVGGIGDPLIIDAQAESARETDAVIGFEDILAAVMRQRAVADEDTDAAHEVALNSQAPR